MIRWNEIIGHENLSDLPGEKESGPNQSYHYSFSLVYTYFFSIFLNFDRMNETKA